MANFQPEDRRDPAAERELGEMFDGIFRHRRRSINTVVVLFFANIIALMGFMFWQVLRHLAPDLDLVALVVIHLILFTAITVQLVVRGADLFRSRALGGRSLLLSAPPEREALTQLLKRDKDGAAWAAGFFGAIAVMSCLLAVFTTAWSGLHCHRFTYLLTLLASLSAVSAQIILKKPSTSEMLLDGFSQRSLGAGAIPSVLSVVHPDESGFFGEE